MDWQDNSLENSSNLFRNMLEIENQQIEQLGNKFAKTVQKPIEIRQNLMKVGENQRCLEHNIMYSIYCTICRKTLCASCMYNNNFHRKHRVKPLQNAMDQLREDIKTFEGKIPKIIQECEGIISSNSNFLVNLQREFSPLIIKLQQFYDKLQKELKMMKKHQLSALKEKQEMVKNQIGIYNRELSKISQFVLQKYKSYIKNQQKFTLILPARTILQSLISAGQYVKTPLVDLDKYSFNLTQTKINKIHDEIMYKLASLLMNFEPILDNSKIKSKPKPKHHLVKKNVSFADMNAINKKKDKDLFEKRRHSSIAGVRTRY